MKLKNKIVIGVLSLTTVLTLAACGSKKIVSMKGGSITVEDFYNKVKNQAAGKSSLQNMIIFKVFSDRYGDQVTDKEVNKEVAKLKKQYGDQYKDVLKQNGFSSEQELKKEAIIPNLAMKVAMKKEAKKKINKKLLEETFDEFTAPITMQIAEFKDKAAAEAFLADAKKPGADFEKTAKEKSATIKKITADSTSTKVSADVLKAAAKLDKGAISEVIAASSASASAMSAGATSSVVVKVLNKKEKGHSITPYKAKLTKMAEDKLMSDQAFTMEVIKKNLKNANVKVQDSAFDGVLEQFGIGENSASTKNSSSSSKKKVSTSKKTSSSNSSSTVGSSSTSSSAEQSSSKK